MKHHDWQQGIFHPLNLLVRCFQTHAHRPMGVEFKIKASSYDDANTEVQRVLSQHHGNFLRKTHGHYSIQYVNETKHKHDHK